MSNHLYGYGAPTPALSDSYLSDPALHYLTVSGSDLTTKYSSTMYHHLTHSASHSQPTWPPGVDVPPIPGVDSLLPPGVKRSSEELYNQTVLGAHDTIGQTEAWYTHYSLGKRTRLESASYLPVYPQRPGEKDCAHYMRTRTCKFGDSCKFDHPIWVPEGGIPDWKEVLVTATDELLPERVGEPDCPYFMKTQRCKYGSKCRFNHPKDNLATADASENPGALPERPFETPCAFYMKTGQCKFGSTCKYHHPKDIQIASVGQDNANGQQTGSVFQSEGTMNVDVTATPVLYHNSKGLPVRLGEVDCPFYLKTGSCKYGASCRYSHPDRNAFIPPAAALGHSLIGTTTNLNIGVINPAASIYQTVDPLLAQQTLGVGTTVLPQRHGQAQCDYYMKTGECKFGERCRFDHPIDRSAIANLSLAGLPRREGAAHCPFYMKTSSCKFGAQCRFDHPPPGEVMAMATLQAASGTGDEKGTEGNEDQ